LSVVHGNGLKISYPIGYALDANESFHYIEVFENITATDN